MQWICDRAIERADKYGIKGVTYKLTMGVTKNIIPAVASTNAIISASCVNETIKILTGCATLMDVRMQYMGQSKLTCSAMKVDRDMNCFACNRETIKVTVRKSQKFDHWLNGPRDEEGRRVLDDKDKAVKGFADERLYTGPTLTRDTDTN